MSEAPLPLVARAVARTFTSGPEPVHVLRGVDISIAAGERVAITGASGSGKSTLLHVLAGLDRPDSGEIEIAGQPLARLTAAALARLRNRQLGFVYQFHHLLPEFTALENTCMPLLIGGWRRTAAEARGRDLLELVDLGARLGHRPGQLSGGERQRVAVARALVANPVLVLADEPTGNLDPRNAERVQQLMMTLGQELGTAFLIVTHDVSLAARADRTLRLDDGVLVPDGPAA